MLARTVGVAAAVGRGQSGGMSHSSAPASPSDSSAAIEYTEVSALTDDRVDAIRRVAAEAESADGVAPLGEQPLLALSRPQPGITHLLALTDAGEVAGYAQAADSDEGQDVEFVVAVPFRGRGIGSGLVERLLRRHERMRFWAHGDRPGARAIAEANEMVVVRELLVMERHREAADPEVLDGARRAGEGRGDGVEIVTLAEAHRRFGEDEVDTAILRVNNAAFAWHPEQGGWTLETLRERMDVAWFDAEGFFLAIEPGSPLRALGFHWTKTVPVADGEPPLGEVYVVGVDPSAQGRGLGQVLTAVGIAHLEAEGIDTVELYVEGDNERAIHAYEKLGFIVSKRDVMYGPDES